MSSEIDETLAKHDDWRDVKDPKKRKQIQDRLAQRARRKRLAQQKAHKQDCLDRAPASLATIDECSSAAICRVQCHGRTVISFGAFTSTPYAISWSQTFDVVVPKIMDEANLPVSCHSAYAALYDNGQLLGLSCSTVKRSRSQYDCTDLPQSLHPTKLQKEVCHPEWIDRIPFPYARDACISLLDFPGEEEFVADLFRMASFVVLHGYVSWDPAGWVMTVKFKAKWGHLFFPNQSESTSPS